LEVAGRPRSSYVVVQLSELLPPTAVTRNAESYPMVVVRNGLLLMMMLSGREYPVLAPGLKSTVRLAASVMTTATPLMSYTVHTPPAASVELNTRLPRYRYVVS